MQVKSLFVFGVVGLAAVAGIKGRQAEQAEIQKIAVEQKLSADETAAFRSCVTDMKSKNLTQKSDNGSVTLSSVPKEICVCQAREMVKTLTPAQYGENARAVKLFGEEDKIGALTQIANEPGPASERVLKLSLSLGACLVDFRTKRDAAKAEAFARSGRGAAAGGKAPTGRDL